MPSPGQELKADRLYAPFLKSITGMDVAPGGDLTFTQNSVVAFKSVQSGALANTLTMQAGIVQVGPSTGAIAAAEFRVYNNNAGFPSVTMVNKVAGGATSGGLLQVVNDTGAATTTSSRLGAYSFSGVTDAASSIYRGASIAAYAAENWSGTQRGAYLQIETTAAGATSRSVRVTVGANGNVLVGTSTDPGARMNILSTSEQLRLGYDGSNYYSTTISSDGNTAYNATSATAAGGEFQFVSTYGSTTWSTAARVTGPPGVLNGVGTVTSSGTTVTGSGTGFLTKAVAGDRIASSADAYATYVTITQVTNDTTLTTDTALGAGATPRSYRIKRANLFVGAGITADLLVNDAGNIGAGTSTPGAKFHAVATTEQFRLGYNATTFVSHVVDSALNYSVTPNGAAYPGFAIDAGGSLFKQGTLFRHHHGGVTDDDNTLPKHQLIGETKHLGVAHSNSIGLASSTVNMGGGLPITGDVTLTSSAGFTSTGNVAIGSEVIHYTSVVGNVLTGCTRGYSGSLAATHANGASVQLLGTSTLGVLTEVYTYGLDANNVPTQYVALVSNPGIQGDMSDPAHWYGGIDWQIAVDGVAANASGYSFVLAGNGAQVRGSGKTPAVLVLPTDKWDLGSSTYRFRNAYINTVNVMYDATHVTVFTTDSGGNSLMYPSGANAVFRCGTSGFFIADTGGNNRFSFDNNGILTIGGSTPKIIGDTAAGGLVLQAGGSGTPQIVIDNSAGSSIASIDNTGNLDIASGSIRTGNPTSGTRAAWNLGSYAAASVTLDTAHYVQIAIAGVAYKLAVVT